MLRIELTYDWMCDMFSRVDAINNNKSIARFRWIAIISQEQFFQFFFFKKCLISITDLNKRFLFS